MKRPRLTLIAGALGAGKTSVLHHFLSEIAAGPVALFIEAVGSPNIDARALRGLAGAMSRPGDQIWEVPVNNARGPWLEAKLKDIFKGSAIDHVLVEISALNPCGQLKFWTQLFAESSAHPQVIHVVDALDFFRNLSDSQISSFHDPALETATLLVLNKCDLVTAKERDLCIDRLCRLNPQAAWTETSYGEIPENVWGQVDQLEARAGLTSEETGSSFAPIDSLLFQSARPFHPSRLWDWFQAAPPGLLRAKGIFWLATRHLVVGGMSRTRCQNSCGPAGVWWDALPREEWPQDEAALHSMQETWSEPYGDRRQELVLIGEAAALSVVAENLERCLLTDAEFSLTLPDWSKLSDPFPPWDLTET